MKARPGKYTTILLLTGLPLFILPLIRLLTGFNGLYGQDSHAFYQAAMELNELLRGEATDINFFWPYVYPLSAAPWFSSPTPGDLVMQMTCCSALAGCLMFSGLILRNLFPEQGKWSLVYLIIIIFLSPYFFRGGYLVMSDMPAAFFILAALHFMIRSLDSGKRLFLFTAMLFSLLAFFTRYQTALLLAVPLFYTWIRSLRQKDWWPPVLAAILAVGGFFLFWWMQGFGSRGFTAHPYLTEWNPLNFFRNEFHSADGAQHYRLPNLLYAFSLLYHPAWLMAGIFMLVFIRKNQFTGKIIILLFIPLLLYILFLAGIPFQNQRFLLIALPVFGIWMYPAFYRLMEQIRFPRLRTLLLVILAAGQSGMIIWSGKDFVKLNHKEREIAATLKQICPEESRLYVFDLEPALKTYGIRNPMQNIWTREYPGFEKGSMVILNTRKLEPQWTGRNPAINWEKMKKENNPLLITDFGHGWELYELR